MSSRSTVHWPCRYVCCLLARCTLGYRCRSLWTHMLYQRHFADHLQELWGQDHSWQLQGGHSYNFAWNNNASKCKSAQAKQHAKYSQTVSIETWNHARLTFTGKWNEGLALHSFSPMVSSHYHVCQVTGKATDFPATYIQHGRFLRSLTTNAIYRIDQYCLSVRCIHASVQHLLVACTICLSTYNSYPIDWS